MSKEAQIVINKVELTQGQSLVVRVAVTGMLTDLEDQKHLKALGEIGPLYVERLKEVETLLLKNIG